MSEVMDSAENKHEAQHHEMEQLGMVHSKDSLHRNELGHDATDLQNYWASPRLIGSIAAAFLLANSIYIGYALPVNILSVINADIGPSPNIYLVSLVYTLFTGVLHLFFARLSDILGRRYFLVGGQTFGVIGSIICATGNSINVLIAGSVLAGIGGAAGLLYPVVIHELVPNKHRHWSQAAITLAVLPTLGFGPAIARTMIAQTSVGWRGVYWLNVAVSGASVVLFATCYFPPNFHMINSDLTKWDEVKSLDYGVSRPGLFRLVSDSGAEFEPGRSPVFCRSYPGPSRLHLGTRHVSLAERACSGNIDPRRCYSDSFWRLRDLYASQTALAASPPLQNPEHRRVRLRRLDHANGLAGAERLLADPNQRTVHLQRDCHWPDVLHYRYRIGCWRAHICPHLPEHRPSEMADGGRELNDCCLRDGDGRGDAQDGEHGSRFHHPCGSRCRLDRDGHDCHYRPRGAAQRYRCCPGLFWFNTLDFWYCCR
jgi:hypothetical protein